jgi:hypothetical protein
MGVYRNFQNTFCSIDTVKNVLLKLPKVIVKLKKFLSNLYDGLIDGHETWLMELQWEFQKIKIKRREN